mmetsp:Transcript_35929/g.87273  ORF Transcript_35929/g.87273 Transcript_35929/m.87273 type:complete len:84 (+) Transcript_35929:165-416(+)
MVAVEAGAERGGAGKEEAEVEAVAIVEWSEVEEEREAEVESVAMVEWSEREEEREAGMARGAAMLVRVEGVRVTRAAGMVQAT